MARRQARQYHVVRHELVLRRGPVIMVEGQQRQHPQQMAQRRKWRLAETGQKLVEGVQYLAHSRQSPLGRSLITQLSQLSICQSVRSCVQRTPPPRWSSEVPP